MAGLDLALAALELGPSSVDDRGLRGLVVGGVALGLVGDGVGLGDPVAADLGHAGEHIVAVVDLGVVRDGLVDAGLGDQLLLQLDRLADPGLGRPRARRR